MCSFFLSSQVTLELSCCKYPPAGELPRFWEDNKGSLMQFIGEAHRGVRGFVKDELIATPIEGASMKVRGEEMKVKEVGRTNALFFGFITFKEINCVPKSELNLRFFL